MRFITYFSFYIYLKNLFSILYLFHSGFFIHACPYIARLFIYNGNNSFFCRMQNKTSFIELNSLVELCMEFQRLMGESAKDILQLAGKDNSEY